MVSERGSPQQGERSPHYDPVVNLHVEHDAARLARITGASRAACDGVILRHGDASQVLASTHRDNPLAGNWLLDVDAPGSRAVAWSGTLADGLFERDLRTWTAPGRRAFADFCDALAPQLATHSRTLCFHPHARHVLNDVPSCLGFLRDRAGQPFEIAFAPASLLESSMLDRIEEHLQRQFESLGHQCAMLLLHDVRVVSDGDEEARCEAAELGQGLLPRDLVISLIRDHLRPEMPIVIDGRGGGASITRQIEWLMG